MTREQAKRWGVDYDSEIAARQTLRARIAAVQAKPEPMLNDSRMMSVDEVKPTVAEQEQRMWRDSSGNERTLAGWRALWSPEAPSGMYPDDIAKAAEAPSCDPPIQRTVEDLYETMRWALLNFNGHSDVSEGAQAEAAAWLDALDRREAKLKAKEGPRE